MMVDGRLPRILDRLGWYSGDSPWGSQILPLGLCYEAMPGEDPNLRMGVEEHRVAQLDIS